jgi:tetratricopeptide (TPR) repeat protein
MIEERFPMNRFRRMLILPPLFLLALFTGTAAPDSSSVPRSGADSLRHAVAALYGEGLYEEILRAYKGCSSDSLPGFDAFYLGSSYAMLGDFRAAVPLLRRAVTLAPGHATYRLQLARVLAQGGRMPEARTEYDVLTGGERPFTPALTSYGIFLFDDGNVEDAFTAFRRSLAANPRDYLAYYYAGACCDRSGQTDSAMMYLATSTSLNPGFVPSASLLASLYYAQKEYRQSLLLYERLCRQRPHNPDYWYKAGLCCEYAEDYDRAIDLYRRAAALDSTDVLPLAHLGQIYFTRNMFDSSVAAYRRAVGIDPANPSLLLNLGLGLARLHDNPEAMNCFQRAAAAHHLDRAAVPYTQMGALLYNEEQYRRARTMYTRALALDPRNMEALFFIGFTHEQAGATEAARSAFRKFLKAAAGDPALKKRIAVVEERLRKLPRRQ